MEIKVESMEESVLSIFTSEVFTDKNSGIYKKRTKVQKYISTLEYSFFLFWAMYDTML